MFYNKFVSESVCEGHPDKICDQISDAVLDEALKLDPASHVGVECLVTKNRVIVSGEVKSQAEIDYEAVAREVIRSLDYTDPKHNFDYKTAKVEVLVHEQSPDIDIGVSAGGAGDQGMMFGYATNESKEYMPMPILLAHKLVEGLDMVRKKKQIPYLRPDGKSEVVVSYDKKGRPAGVDMVVIAVPHKEGMRWPDIKPDIYEYVVIPILSNYKFKINMDQLIVNGTGQWFIGGPSSDMGETGRKIVVDTYGGMGRVGGGCFSGKDPTKVDRSASYATRYIAKNIVASGRADKCEVMMGFVIGQPEPIVKGINCKGTAKYPQKEIEKYAWSLLPMTVQGMIKELGLHRPVPYRKTARYGHFGHAKYPWERLVDK
jgi:S-adenosylmethionine synthetase